MLDYLVTQALNHEYWSFAKAINSFQSTDFVSQTT